MYLSRWSITLFSIFALTSCTSSKGQSKLLKFPDQKVIILSNGDDASTEVADYLYQHLTKRNKEDKTSILRADNANPNDKSNLIYLELVADLNFDYEINNIPGKLSLFAKDRETMIWLIYELITQLGEEIDLDTHDLPPAIINFKNGQFNFAIRYREPHLLSNTNPDLAGIYHNNSVDEDWGIWGHNFKKVFDGKIPEASYAQTEKGIDKKQFCFSSDATINAIKSYLDTQRGNGVQWFMVTPNDNNIACTCASCKKLGNKPGQATAAISHLLNSLAKSYPNYFFFTTAYLTTKNAPTIQMEKNTGVFISTIDFTKLSKINQTSSSVKDFESLVRQWKEKVNEVYLWDYIANFDDYLSPYPVLYRFQNQLSFFQSIGVNGFFLNGSGYDYSPFEDIKTYVLSAMMMNPTLDTELLIRNYCDRFYPVSGKIIADYLLEIEEKSTQSKSEIGMYSPFRDLMKSFLDQGRFQLFYKNLSEIITKTNPEERTKLDRLILALSYTKLQFQYHKGNLENGFLLQKENTLWVNPKYQTEVMELAAYSKKYHQENYKEFDGKISSYVSEWNHMLTQPMNRNSFQLKNVVDIKMNQSLQEGKLLNNNLPGFLSDFNQGWLLAGNDIKVIGNVVIPETKLKTIRMRFLSNPRHRMLRPDKIEILKDGTNIVTVLGKELIKKNNSFQLEKTIMLDPKQQIEVRINKNRNINKSVIACDEIEIF
ncbi:DUF4838 domain-containing protein [Sphingobacterium sp. WM]|uniref:DUF4838 domain-containing protein n=1 Tax=Sphingobacterium sp. WM TaxID=3031802 RepID=UPI00240DCDB6|nr:DUF4838 domain-containing protein [Sphingobacterium sp. WM]WFB63667.1 DUF4838 domain-containing protein [Sphingobacterium sp. WM]